MEGPQVQLVATCLVDALAPHVGRATVSVLETAGCQVSYPQGQTCCGQPAHNAGYAEQARAMAAHTVDLLDATEGPIVLPSGSCTDMIVHHYPEIFEGTEREEAARRVSTRTRELTQFLVDDLGALVKARCDGCSVAYHHSCHGLMGLGLGSQADDILSEVERVELDGDTDCCGFGGLFSLEMPSVSAAIMDEKLDRIEASGADVVAGGDVACLIHMEGGLRRRGSGVRVRHIAELMAGPEA
ncbi:MAG: (Fe-S)-binding protein [Acidimicrobiia bacterium]|nr:(Fe-S)-binding protein [Acidimicrobiia bacterium]